MAKALAKLFEGPRFGAGKLLPWVAGLWIVFVINGFRPPWQPIVVSDSNSGGAMRQIVFTGCSGLAIWRLLTNNMLGKVLGYHLGILTLGMLMVGSVLISIDPVLTIKRSLLYVLGFFLVVGAVHDSKRPLNTYLRVVVYVTAACAWVSLLAHFGLPKNCTTIEERPGLAGVSGHPNTIGPCLFMAICMSLGITPDSERERKGLLFAQAGLFFAIALSNSVTAIIATMVGCGIYYCVTAPTYKVGSLQIAGCILAGAVGIVGVKETKAMMFAAAGRDESMSGRDELWSQVFNEGLKNPLFGAGYGSFWYEGRGREITGTWNPRQSHNAYIDVFVEIGLMGTLIVLAVIHMNLITSWYALASKRRTAQRKAVGALFATGAALCCVAAFGESFLLKMEKFQFFVFSWGLIALENGHDNRVEVEFAEPYGARPATP